MKILIVLTLFIAHVFCDCSLASINPDWPKPHILRCDEISPDKSEFLLKYEPEKSMDYIQTFYFKKFKGNLSPQMISKLSGVRDFELIDSDFPVIPNGFFDVCAEKLEFLKISNNELKTIEADVFKNLFKLRNLYVFGNQNLLDFDINWLSSNNKLEILGLPTKTFKELDVDKLKELLPKLKFVGVAQADKEKVHDKIEEVEKVFKVFFE